MSLTDDELAALELLVDAAASHMEQMNSAAARLNAIAEVLVLAGRQHLKEDGALWAAAIGEAAEIENAS